MAEFKIQTSNRIFTGLSEADDHTWNGAFTFIQAADTQFGMMDCYLHNRKDEKNTWDADIALARRTVEIANAMSPRPQFLVICGDLIDAMPGDPNKPLQTRDFKEVYSHLSPNIPLVCVCGNHDIGNIPTHDAIDDYRKSFGDDYFSFWSGGVKFIVLNSQFFEDDSQVQDLSAAQEAWMDTELEDGRHAQHLVVFQHIPIFLYEPDEPKQYFNLDFPIRRHLLTKFKAAGVRTIFCGHFHRNAGGFYDGMELVVTSAVGCQLGDAPHGMRLVQVTSEAITHKYYALDDWPMAAIQSATS